MRSCVAGVKRDGDGGAVERFGKPLVILVGLEAGVQEVNFREGFKIFEIFRVPFGGDEQGLLGIIEQLWLLRIRGVRALQKQPAVH